MFIFTPHGFGSHKGSLSPLQSPGGAGAQLLVLLSLSAEPSSDWMLLIMKQNKRDAASIEQAIDAKIKEEANKTQLEREQFKA